MFKRLMLILFSAILISACFPEHDEQQETALHISCLLEQAIEIGEKYLSDSDMIEQIALAEGMDAAVKVYDAIHHRANYEAFWACLDEAADLCRQVTDSAELAVIRIRVMPYIDRLDYLTDNIY